MMSPKKLVVGIAIVATACLAGSSLALASGNAKPITRSCGTSDIPSANQVFIYDASLACWVLELNWPLLGDLWAGYDVSEGFPNDTIRYVRVGSDVRVRFFWNWFYTHDEGCSYTQSYTGEWLVHLGSMAGNASAARVESTLQPYNCETRPGYLSIWDTTGAPTNCDCTTLSDISGPYPGAVAMAFRNDNLSAFAGGGRGRSLYNDGGYINWITDTYQMYCMNAADLPSCGINNYSTSNADNKVSSIE